MFNTNENLDKCPICEKDIVISYKQVDFACSDKDCPLGRGVDKILDSLENICGIVNKIYNIKSFMEKSISRK